MQIDFHHAVTYVVARSAGFKHEEAEIIAYSSQYVDDATNNGIINFDNGAMYNHVSSAHKMLDYRNFEQLANQFVWLPFHFLPGNGGEKAGENPSGKFIKKIKCKPDSYVASDMIRACIEDKDKTYRLHRLGITMHVYADTWAHQGFSGVKHSSNKVSVLNDHDDIDSNFASKLGSFFGDIFDNVKSNFVDEVLPLGHGAVLSNPDLPFLKWDYKDNEGNIVRRDNTADFIVAADRMCAAMKRFIAGDPDAEVDGLTEDVHEKIEYLLGSIRDRNGEDREEKWLEKIREGYFGFSGINVSYISKGKDSWKYNAIGTENNVDDLNCKFEYDPAFLRSNWKFFHDALQAHRFTMIHNIFPRYGICSA